MAILVIWDPRFTLFKNGLLTPIENDVFLDFEHTGHADRTGDFQLDDFYMD